MRVLAIVASVQPPCIRRARPSFQLIVALCFWTLLCNLGMLTPRGQAQDQPASQTPRLDVSTADAWATLVLKGVDTEFPNKMSIVYVDETQIKSPREFFPAFYGSFDTKSPKGVPSTGVADI